MLKSCKTSTPSNPASVSKKPRIPLNFTKPNGHRPLGFLITSSYTFFWIHSMGDISCTALNAK